jgi:hypothetical protein
VTVRAYMAHGLSEEFGKRLLPMYLDITKSIEYEHGSGSITIMSPV